MKIGNSAQYFRAFVTDMEQPALRELGSGDWQTYDDLEEDLRFIQSEVVELLNIHIKSSIFNETEKIFEDVSYMISGYDVTIEEGSSIILNFLRRIIQRELFGYQINEFHHYSLVDRCYKLLSDINTCETNIWHHRRAIIGYHLYECERSQYNAYLHRNKPFFESLQPYQYAFLNNLIEWNMNKICNGNISAREGIWNIEKYVTSL